MRRRSLVSTGALVLLALGWSTPIGANICAFDAVPAATLLFPYVVFDYNHPAAGMNSILGITNMSAAPCIVHVELWTDYALPIFNFNIVLSGYDVQSFSIRDILYYGMLPVTGTGGDLIVDGPFPNPEGPVSGSTGSWTNNLLPDATGTNSLYTRCPPSSSHYPGNQSPLDVDDLVILREYLTASQASTLWHNNCYGSSYEGTTDDWWTQRGLDQPTWMYVTANVVWECNGLNPDQPAYWTDQSLYDNVLFGDIMWVNNVENQIEIGNAVHIEADLQIGNVATRDGLGNPITHYYRYSTRNLVTPDYREPLPTSWAFRYMVYATVSTYVRLWKGSTFYQSPVDLYVPASYLGTYLAYDCWAYTYYAWDEDEGVVTASAGPPWPYPGPNLLPLATQEVNVEQFNLPSNLGWMLFVWPNANFDQIPGADPYPDFYQTWMGVRYEMGASSTSRDCVVAGNFNCYSDQVLPTLGVKYDYVGLTGYTTSPPYP